MIMGIYDDTLDNKFGIKARWQEYTKIEILTIVRERPVYLYGDRQRKIAKL